MVDFIKCIWKAKDILENHLLTLGNFEEVLQTVEYHTGEIRYPITTTFDGMELGVSKRSAYLKNSIHKSFNIFSNGKEYNFNLFTYSNLCEQIDYINSRLPKDIREYPYITQLEFGINIPLDTTVRKIIRNNIVMHDLREVCSKRTFSGRGILKQFNRHDYSLKVYDKSAQYGLNSEIMRIEIKILKTRKLESMGVFSIGDLKNKDVLENLFNELMHRFKQLTIIDDYNEDDINDNDLTLLRIYSNPRYWQVDIKSKSGTTKARHRKKFDRILEKYNLLNIKAFLMSLMLDVHTYQIKN